MKLFHPIIAGAHFYDRLVACVGAFACIAITILLCSALGIVPADLPVIVAPIGASAVLVFAVPASPLAQPWPVIGGNIVSALVGVAVVRHGPSGAAAAGLAVGGAILIMSLLRCLHPPGGAAALTVVIGGNAVHAAGWSFAFVPVGLNSLALVALGILFHRATRHSYPHRPARIAMLDPTGLDLADIDAALDDMHESFDISRADLDALLTRAEVHALARRKR